MPAERGSRGLPGTAKTSAALLAVLGGGFAGMEAVRVLERRLEDLKAGRVPRRPQEESAATRFGKRRPEDGRIDWNEQTGRNIDPAKDDTSDQRHQHLLPRSQIAIPEAAKRASIEEEDADQPE